ncbi:MAG TPA: hypothetical protein VLX44_06990 [Xanthobacteraceae bacterium]|nr:hypothetical protein [Xanthobacteraceae bacterium]
MNIVAKSRTGRGCATEFVAASAKARPWLALGLVLGLTVGLSACSSTLSEMPSQMGGLPAGAPERPATPAAYPAVHDMPPPRPNTVLTADEAKKTEDDLAALRARQEKAAGTLNTTGSTGSISKDQQAQQ